MRIPKEHNSERDLFICGKNDKYSTTNACMQYLEKCAWKLLTTYQKINKAGSLICPAYKSAVLM